MCAEDVKSKSDPWGKKGRHAEADGVAKKEDLPKTETTENGPPAGGGCYAFVDGKRVRVED